MASSPGSRSRGGKSPDGRERQRLVRFEQETHGDLVSKGLRVGGERLDEGGFVSGWKDRDDRSNLGVQGERVAPGAQQQWLHERAVALLSGLFEEPRRDHPSHQRARPEANVDLRAGEQAAEENQDVRLNLVAPRGLVDLFANGAQRFARLAVAAVGVDPQTVQLLGEFEYRL